MDVCSHAESSREADGDEVKTTLEVVQFKDGSYAIRETKYTWWGIKKQYTFVSLNNLSYRWDKQSPFFTACVGSRNQVLNAFNRLIDMGESVYELSTSS